ILMEEQGVPAIAIVTAPFRNTGRAMAESWGKPGYPFLDTPHPIANLTEADLDERADRLADAVGGGVGLESHSPGGGRAGIGHGVNLWLRPPRLYGWRSARAGKGDAHVAEGGAQDLADAARVEPVARGPGHHASRRGGSTEIRDDRPDPPRRRSGSGFSAS